MVQVKVRHKVLTFCPLPPTITGGIEEYAYSVIRYMRSKEYEVIVVTSMFGDKEKYPDSGENYIYIPSFSIWKRPIPKNIFALLKLVTSIRNSDIVHIHMPYPLIESFVAIAARIFGKKVIVTYHADARIDAGLTSKIGKSYYALIEKAYSWLSSRWALTFSEVVCTNTMDYASSSPVLKNYLGKIKVIHQGIREDLYNQLDVLKIKEIRSKYLNSSYDHIVTFVGRLVPYKGLYYLIKAIKFMREDNSTTLFVIGGSGPEKPKLIKMVNSYGLDNVKFIGFVPDEVLFNLFAASDLVVSPSVSNLESTPISLLCALSTGTPVIGTNVGGTGETIPNDKVSGAVIPPCDSKILAETMVSMLCIKGKGRIEKPRLRFWSDVADDYIKLFKSLTKHGSSVMNRGLVES